MQRFFGQTMAVKTQPTCKSKELVKAVEVEDAKRKYYIITGLHYQ